MCLSLLPSEILKMSDIIRLLPDSVANQIAAGEVIQRPSSAVKELLENAVDAGSTQIELFIKDSGRTLIQIVDNGTGMSPTDARLSFSRHATSKIRNAADLFSIRTKGFRGEALASIASIAQVELKTRRLEDELGTCILIEGAEISSQTAIAASPGTTISIRNLFFNVPARRNFLKSNNVEARHIIEEFERVALAHPEVAMSLHQNGIEIFQLPVANQRQRIVSVYGSHYNERLVPVMEETSLLSITGFIGKPAFSKKSRGEQFFFVNKRFIRDGYLNHAVTNAFEELLEFDNNTKVLKFYMHISSERQQEKLQERIDDPAKNWKHKAADWDENDLWDEYMKSYEYAINNSNIQWHIVPCDKRYYRNYIIAKIVLETLEAMSPQLPVLDKSDD